MNNAQKGQNKSGKTHKIEQTQHTNTCARNGTKLRTRIDMSLAWLRAHFIGVDIPLNCRFNLDTLDFLAIAYTDANNRKHIRSHPNITTHQRRRNPTRLEITTTNMYPIATSIWKTRPPIPSSRLNEMIHWNLQMHRRGKRIAETKLEPRTPPAPIRNATVPLISDEIRTTKCCSATFCKSKCYAHYLDPVEWERWCHFAGLGHTYNPPSHFNTLKTHLDQ